MKWEHLSWLIVVICVFLGLYVFLNLADIEQEMKIRIMSNESIVESERGCSEYRMLFGTNEFYNTTCKEVAIRFADIMFNTSIPLVEIKNFTPRPIVEWQR